MLLVVLLDLGDTLVDGDVAKPHAQDALEALSALTTPAGAPAERALVSDYLAPGPGASAEALFDQYVANLERLGFRRFFEPVQRRVTLSTQAGVSKPDRRIFELALRRLGKRGSLSQCLFVTENAQHVAAARALGMTALQFGVDFSDWAEGPLVVAWTLGLRKGPAFEAALRVYLASRGQLGLQSLQGEGPDYVAQVKRPHPVPGPDLGPLDGVLVDMPARATIRLGATGRVASFQIEDPDAEAITEAHGFLASLQARGAVARPGQHSPGATHEIAIDPAGRPVLRRTRFSGG